MVPQQLKNLIQQQMADGRIGKGELLPLSREGALRFRTTPQVIEQAYDLLLAEDAIVDIGGKLYACSFEECKRADFNMPYEFLRATGRHYSMRREDPGQDFHLRVSEWTQVQPSPRKREGAERGHSHDFVEVTLVTSGSGFHVFQGREFPVVIGDCFSVLPGEQHGFRDTRDLRVVNLMFYPKLLAGDYPYLAEIPGFRRFFTIEPLFRYETSFTQKLHLSMSQQEECSSLLNRLAAELDAKRPGYRVAARALCLQCIVFLCRAYDASVKSRSVHEQFGHKERVVADAVAYLEQNYANDVRLGDVAGHVFMSPSRLQHLFKERAGTSLTDYLLKLRLEQACELLRTTDAKITQVALRSGFHDPAYFTRVFSKAVGKSPSQYRRSCADRGASPSPR